MRQARITLVLVPVLLLAGCGSNPSGASEVIRLLDNCNPTTFNAAQEAGTGTCQHPTLGIGLTVQDFNAKLRDTRTVAAWKIEPATFSVKAGSKIMLLNNGGQAHTYTEVAEFGGGAVPVLNQLSGNPDPVPECASAATVRGSGLFSGQVRMQAFDRVGTAKFQCCIHPWMRQTVTVF